MRLDGNLAALATPPLQSSQPMTSEGSAGSPGGRSDAGFECFMVPDLREKFLAETPQKRTPEGAVVRCPAGFALDSGHRGACCFGSVQLHLA